MSNWRQDVDSALGSKNEQCSDDEDASRRNSFQWEGDLPTIQLNVVDEEDEPLRPLSPPNRASLGRSSSMRNPDALPADIPEGVSMTARNSLITLINAMDQEFANDRDHDLKIPPPSAASTVTLFEFNPSDGPLAESTPHESNKTHSRYSGSHQAIPPVPPLPPNPSRRSSIVYIKSNENATPTTTTATTTTTTTTTSCTTTTTRPSTPSPKRVAEWSSRVRPLVPKSKTSKLQLKSKPSVSENAGVTSSPKGGLRALSLLKDRDINRGVPSQSTRPLVVGKKHKKVVDENSGEERSPARKGLRPLKLVRSETTKQRAALRESEILPEVVVRPPSESQNVGFGFPF